MRGTSRTLMTAWLLLPFAAAAPALAANPTSKTAKQCNNELRQNEAALDAAGESASTFFHECWWHTKAGTPTPVQAAAKEAKAESSKDDGDKGGEHTKGGEYARGEAGAEHAAHHPARRRAERRSFYRAAETSSRRRREEASETYLPPRAAYMGAVAPIAPPPDLPTQVNVNVPAVGSLSVPILPIPGLAATVRDVVDHPVVPGIVTATP